jgi:hypothetical protein
MTDKVYIYGLADPRDRKIRYVGHTIDLDQRTGQHLTDPAKTPKTAWIAELAALGLRPIMVELDEVDYAERFTVEYRWIYLGRQRGWPLTNTSAMKTEKYIEMAADVESKVFVELDNGLTLRKIHQLIFGISNLPVDSRLAFFRLFSAMICVLSVFLSITILFDLSITVDLVSVIIVATAMASIASLVSMLLYMASVAKDRLADQGMIDPDIDVKRIAYAKIEEAYNDTFARIFPDSEVKFKVSEDGKKLIKL